MQCKPTGEAIDDGRRHATTITHRALGVGAIKPTRKSYEWDDGDDDGCSSCVEGDECSSYQQHAADEIGRASCRERVLTDV